MSKKTSAYLKTVYKIFLVAAISVMCVMVLTSCIKFTGFRGSGSITSSQRDVSGVKSVSISAGMNLYIEQTGTESLKVEAEDNIIPKILTEVKNGHLTIRFKPWTMGFSGISTTEPVNIYLTVKDLDSIKASSGANLNCGMIDTAKLAISLSSGSNGEAAVEVSDLDINLSSGSMLTITGNAKNQDVDLSSGVKYDAESLVSENARLDVSSGAVAIVSVSKSLDVDISSGGVVSYTGSPQIISDISSGGTLKNITGN